MPADREDVSRHARTHDAQAQTRAGLRSDVWLSDRAAWPCNLTVRTLQKAPGRMAALKLFMISMPFYYLIQT